MNAIEMPEMELDEDVGIGLDTPSTVILFNDEIHTFDEVIVQIIKAVKCSADRAKALTWEVHSHGKAAVFEGDMPSCIHVSGVLEEIGLHTQIEV
ncbi:MAG: ATP-dependent Clp protease adaptor ClpS [Bacteroidetes bacterium]|nr:MAG: ATP-dependent Clp protease adaptor ClpS [Bacteroidota bacterium]